LAGAFDKLEGVTKAKDRIDLLVEYLGKASVAVREDDIVLTGADRHANDEWWWALLQKKVSGFAFFNYESIYKRFVGEFPEEYEYATFEECLDTEHLAHNGYVVVAGYIAEMEIKKTKKGEMMARLTLEANYEFLEVMIFQQEYQQLSDLLVAGRANLLLINGVVSYDKRKESNILRANYETNTVTLTL